MAEHDALGHGIWQRGGVDVEVLPDPLGREASAPPATPTEKSKSAWRRWWRWGFTAFGAVLLVTLLWLIVTAPLSRSRTKNASPAASPVGSLDHGVSWFSRLLRDHV